MIPDELSPKPAFHSIRPVVMSKRGLVVAGTSLAAHAGVRMLEQGGNAIDAAIAAAGVQAVVMPHVNGFGGDLFLLYRSRTGEVRALNASGPAPDMATREAFISRGFQAVPPRGVETASVPGAVDGWFRALHELGTLEPRVVFEPAVGYARDGFPVYKNLVRYLQSRAFQELRGVSPALDAQYYRGGRPPEVGSLLVQPEMAKMVERMIRYGPNDFYRGETAEHIAETCTRLNGFLRREDLARYESRWVEPISVPYRGFTVFQMPPNSQGVSMLQQLRALESFELGVLGHNTPDYVHLLVEAKKAAFADRDRWLADPDFGAVPVDEMLSSERAQAFARRLGDSRSSEAGGRSDRPRSPKADTTCLTVVDEHGNAVALIQSLFDDFGGGVFVDRAGFALQNRMCGFTLERGHPNVVAPRKRPLHTLCCSLVTRADKLFMVYATPGGHAQTQSLVQILNNVVVFGMDPQEAVEAPRFTQEGQQLLMESRFPSATRAALEARGHQVDFIPAWSHLVGGSATILVHPDAGTRQGGADPRRDSYAIPQ